MHLSVVVPVYRAEECLVELHRRLVAALSSICSDFEIILVEDCGGDNSWPIIQALALSDPRVRGIRFSRNFGQHYGITAGLDFSKGDWVVVMDCDLQDQPEEIPMLYAKAMEGYDVVHALRGVRKDPFWKKILSWFFYKLFRYLTDMEYSGKSANFSIMSRKVVGVFLTMRERLRFFGALVHWMGFTSCGIEVHHAHRFAGESSYTLRKLLSLALDTVIAYSDKPLRLTVKFGVLMVSFSVLYGIYVFIYSCVHGSIVPGWTSLILSLYLVSGVVVSILGILGIYIGKIFDECKKRPLYIIHEATFLIEQ